MDRITGGADGQDQTVDEDQDLGIQELDDDDESQDIFDNFDRNLKQKIVTFNE